MRTDKVAVIARREYLSRIRTKGFWIGTILLPLMMAAMMILPSLFLSRSKANLRVAIVDETGTVGAALAERLRNPAEEPETKEPEAAGPPRRRAPERLATFEVDLVAPAGDREAQRAALDKRVLGKEIDAWLWVSPAGLARNHVEYHGASVSNFLTQERLERVLSEVVRNQRLQEAGYDAARVVELSRSIDLETVHITEKGARAEAGLAGVILAYFLFMMLYLVVAIYGQQVMTGVLEEKTSRVVEVIISTVKPFELMIGKLVGIGLVGLTQIAIWLTTAAVMTAPGVVAGLAWLPEDTHVPSVSWPLIVNFLIFFLLGYFLFATFYAAIGASFNDVREAQQAAASAMFFLLPPVILAMPVINDPDSTMAIVASLIPVFTPLLMMLRIAVKMPPLWQVLLSYVLTAATTVGMVWVCAKIYRVGILMYGKKPTFKELWHWVRYV